MGIATVKRQPYSFHETFCFLVDVSKPMVYDCHEITRQVALDQPLETVWRSMTFFIFAKLIVVLRRNPRLIDNFMNFLLFK